MTGRTRIGAVLLLGSAMGIACGGGEPAEEESGSYTETLGRVYRAGFADRTRGDMKAIGAALAQYHVDAGGFPAAADMTGLASALEPHYLRTVPRADAWDRPFRYSAGGSGFTLTSDGLDGKAGTGDDLVLTDGGFR